MTEAQVEAAVFAWATSVTGWTGARVIWAHPNAPRPDLSYLTLQVFTKTPRGQVYRDQESDGDLTSYSWQELSLQVQAYGADAFDKADTLRLSLQGVVAREAFNAAGLYRRSMPELRRVPVEVGAAFEVRAAMTVRFGLVDSLTEQPGWIEEVVYTQTVYEEDGETVADTRTYTVDEDSP